MPDPHTAVPERGVKGMVTPTETTRSKRRREKATRRLALDSSNLGSESSRERRAPPDGEDTVQGDGERRGPGVRREVRWGAMASVCSGQVTRERSAAATSASFPATSLDWLRLDPGQQLLNELLHRHHLLRRVQSLSLRGSSAPCLAPSVGARGLRSRLRVNRGINALWTQQCPCPA